MEENRSVRAKEGSRMMTESFIPGSNSPRGSDSRNSIGKLLWCVLLLEEREEGEAVESSAKEVGFLK
jgi:hypothetical protein